MIFVSGSRSRLLLSIRFLPALYLLLHLMPAGAQDSDTFVYLPMTTNPVSDCNVPGVSYDSLAPTETTDRPAAQHPDLNLAIRGWSPTTAPLTLVLYGGPTDPGAPQLDTLFAPNRLPKFSSAYQVNHWLWSCNCRGGPITDWDVTLLGMTTSPGEALHLPDSGYDIGGGHDALVLYATENRMTLKYSAEDNVVRGYTIHLEGVCVAPDLLRLYRQLNTAGRQRLPALRGGQPFGRAPSNEIRAAVRDNGTFLDPRSQKDWWKDYPLR